MTHGSWAVHEPPLRVSGANIRYAASAAGRAGRGEPGVLPCDDGVVAPTRDDVPYAEGFTGIGRIVQDRVTVTGCAYGQRSGEARAWT